MGFNYTYWDGVNTPHYFVDFLGQEIHVGDTIIYATASSHSSALTLAEVVEFITHDSKGGLRKGRFGTYTPENGRSWRENEPYFLVRVQPLADSGWKSRYFKDEETGLPKKVVLQVYDKIVKVPREYSELEKRDGR